MESGKFVATVEMMVVEECEVLGQGTYYNFHNPLCDLPFDFRRLLLVVQLGCLDSSYDTHTGTHIWYI